MKKASVVQNGDHHMSVVEYKGLITPPKKTDISAGPQASGQSCCKLLLDNPKNDRINMSGIRVSPQDEADVLAASSPLVAAARLWSLFNVVSGLFLPSAASSVSPPE